MTDLVQARRPFVARLAGIRVLVRAGDLYSANDPLVIAFADKFRAPKVHTTGDSVGPQPASPPVPEANTAAIKEFRKLKLVDEADVPRVAESLAKLDEVTLAALMTEYEISEDTPDAALVALAGTRYSDPAEAKPAAPRVSSKQTSKTDTTKAAKAKASPARKRTAPKKASASKSK